MTDLGKTQRELVIPEIAEPPTPEYVIVSVDIETTATKLLRGDVLSIGACTYWEGNEDRMETFYINLKPMYGRFDADTMNNFWFKFPERYQDTQVDQVDANIGMQNFSTWVKNLGAEPIFMAWPAHFDFMWLDHWFDLANIDNPFSYKPLDQVSYLAGLKKDYKLVKGSRSKGTFNAPESWEGVNLTPHNALSDAIAQRNGFMQMVKDTK